MITSASEFYRLRESDNPEEYYRAAHEEAAIEVWMQIIQARPDMRLWVAHNKTVPISILEILARDEDANVRDMVARKHKITEAIALTLADDPDETVRAALAHNVKLPESARVKLQGDSSPLVLAALNKQFG